MEIKLIIDRLEGEWVILKSSATDTINWPKKLLPNNIREGQILIFKVQTDQPADKDNDDAAKKILNEILNNE